MTYNLLSVSKFSTDNDVVFECISKKCYVKSQDSKHMLIESFLDSNGFYFIPKLVVEPTKSGSSNQKSYFVLPKHINFISCLVVSGFNKSSPSSLWHSRIGHAHFQSIRLA